VVTVEIKRSLLKMLEPIIFNEQAKYFKIKISAGQQIFKSGGVIQLSSIEYKVSSATTEGEVYNVFYNYDEGRFNCSCPNFESIKKYNGVAANCKHIYGVMENLGLIQ
jgi:hypothetical protein